jgi:hexokinase
MTFSYQIETIYSYSDPEGSDISTVTLLSKLKYEQTATKDDISLVKEVCALVSQRGAYIVASGIFLLCSYLSNCPYFLFFV